MAKSFEEQKREIEQMIADGTTVAALQARNPLKFPIPVDIPPLREFRRLGHLSCKKWVIKESEEPCILTQMHNGETEHLATVQLTEEEIDELAESLSRSITSGVTDATTAELSASLGVGGAEIGGSIANTLTRSRTLQDVAATTIARKIRRQLQVTEPLRIGHVSMRCRSLEVPYGLELIVTIRGAVNITRSFVQSINDPRTIELIGRPGIDTSDLIVESSVDPALDIANQVVSRTECATCDCTETWGPVDKGDKTFIPNDAKDAPTDPEFEREKKAQSD